VEYKQPLIVQALVNHDADVNVQAVGKENKFMTPMHLAVLNSDVSSIQFLLQANEVNLVIKAKQKRGKGKTVVHWVEDCDDQRIKELVKGYCLKPQFPKTPKVLNKKPDKKSVAELLEAIRLNEVSQVDLSCNRLSPDEIGILCENLSVNKSLISLTLNYCGLGNQEVEKIIDALINHERIHLLCMMGNTFDNSTLPYFVKLVQRSNSLFSVTIEIKKWCSEYGNYNDLASSLYCTLPNFALFQIGNKKMSDYGVARHLRLRESRVQGLIEAVTNNQQAIVEDLLVQGIWPTIPYRGNTPLHLAVQQGNPDMVMRLRDYYYHLDMPNFVGQTPLNCAEKVRNQALIELLDPCLILGITITEESVQGFEEFGQVFESSSNTPPVLPPRTLRGSSANNTSTGSSPRLSDGGVNSFFRPPVPSKPTAAEVVEVKGQCSPR